MNPPDSGSSPPSQPFCFRRPSLTASVASQQDTKENHEHLPVFARRRRAQRRSSLPASLHLHYEDADSQSSFVEKELLLREEAARRAAEAVALEKEQEPVWYFAIGAMLNPTSLKNRKIVPLESKPATLLNHSLHFFGSIGVAEAVPEVGSSFEGVLHLIDPKAVSILDGVERDYVKRYGVAECYDGTRVDCFVYARDGEVHYDPTVDCPPLERYLDIMIRGCRHFGVSQKYIEKLKETPSQPRPKPHEFHSLGTIPEGAPAFTLAQVEACNGFHGTPLRMTMNGKVLECTLERDSQHWDEFVHLHQQFGHVGELYISRVAFDPKYGLPETLEDFTREHAAYVEDLMYRYQEFTGLPDAWKVIGRFQQSYRD